jgi:hypothetical protein
MNKRSVRIEVDAARTAWRGSGADHLVGVRRPHGTGGLVAVNGAGPRRFLVARLSSLGGYADLSIVPVCT